MLLLQHRVNPPILLTGGLQYFKVAFIWGLENFQNKEGEPLVGKRVENNWGIHRISYIEFQGTQSLNSLNCSGSFLVLEMNLKKSHFWDLFLNSEFLTINFLDYSICDCPQFGSPLCDEILFQFCQRQP